MGLSFEISPSPVILVAELEGIAHELEDFKKPLKESIKNVMVPSIRKNFEAEGRPEPWVPLSQATLNRRRYDASGTTSGILSRTAKLRRRAASQKIWKIEKTDAYVQDLGEDVWYGKLHQEGFEGGGSAIGRIVKGGVPQIPSYNPRKMTGRHVIVEGYAGDIPARPFLLIQDEDVDAIEEEFDKWLTETFAAKGWPMT